MSPILQSISDDAYSKLEQLLIYNEGYKAKPYDDATALEVKAPKGNITWLIGCNLETSGSPELAKWVLQFQLVNLEKELIRSSEGRTFLSLNSPIRKIVILDMAFNLGVDGLIGFKDMWDAIEDKNFLKASLEIQNSALFHEEPERTQRNEKMMFTGQWYNL